MDGPAEAYCYRCGRRVDENEAYCRYCGASQTLSLAERTLGVAYLLNELDREPITDVVNSVQRRRLHSYYSDVMNTVTGRPVFRPAAVPPATDAAAPTPAPALSRTLAPAPIAPPRRQAAPPPARPPAPPREPMDWSWLVDQQANLFLFAGAFLTVVAALIFVGYSGQAVDGVLKMTLLSLYTIAFLAAGTICLRIPRVEIAGRVFFGVGSVLVPLNFVAAHTLLTQESLSITTMWLLGSTVTAAFYGAVACLGLGKPYAFSSGIAIVSATLAAVVRTGVPLEWAPLVFIVVAAVMSLGEIVAPKIICDRVGGIWAAQSRVVAIAAMTSAVVIALAMTEWDSGRGDTTRWFLPLTFATFGAYAAMDLLSKRRAVAGLATMAGVAGTVVSLSYAAHLPAECYGFGFIAVAMLFAYATIVAHEERVAGRLPADAADALHLAALCAAGVAGAVAIVAVLAATGGRHDPNAYNVRTRWFLPATFLALGLYGAIPMFGQRRAAGAVVAIASLGGALMTVVYAMHWPAEYYAIAAATVAIALELARRGSIRPAIARRLPAETEEILHSYAIVAAGASMLVAVCAAALAATGNAHNPNAFSVETRWFLPATFALVMVYGALGVPGRRQEDMLAAIAGFAGALLSVVYAMHWPAEYYAVESGVLAAALSVVGVWSTRPRISERIAPDTAAMLRGAGYAASLAAAAVALGVLNAAQAGQARYAIDSRWFMLGAFVPVVAHFAVDAFGRCGREGVAGLVLSVAAASAALVFGLGVSYEYYAFAALIPALLFAGAARLSANVGGSQPTLGSLLPRLTARLAAEWQDDLLVGVRGLVAVGAAVAVGAVLGSAKSSFEFVPQFRAFLPVAFALAAVCLAIDASLSRRVEISAAFVLAVIATVIAVPYVLHADAAYYGAAFAAAAIVVAFGGRIIEPSWLDERGRDVLAAAAMTVAWLPFEGAYVDAPRVGAGVHFAAAIFYGLAAIFDRSEMTLGGVLQSRALDKTRLSVAWLYAAGLVATVGYLHALNGNRTANDSLDLSAIAVPMFTVAIALWAGGVAVRKLRPDFRLHFYLMALIASVVSLTSADGAQTLAVLLSSYVLMSIVVAVVDDEPLLGAPAALFGIAMIGAWQVQLDLALWSMPAALSVAGVAICAGALTVSRRWPSALTAVGGAYAALAPAAGLAILAYHGSGGTRFYETSLFECSTLTLAVFGALVTAASARGRRWLILPGSAIVVFAVLLQIGRFNPENAQAYTVVVGAYLVLVATFGLTKLRLAPSLAAIAPFIEGAGAAIIMLPSLLQSLDAGWRYEWIVLIEALAFLVSGIALRRRGLLSVAVTALVLVAGRLLFDAVNALPNWVVVAAAGAALLGIGMAILVGRDRWSVWQEAVVKWWAIEPPVQG